MARSLLMDCLIRLLSPVLSLDFSSQDRYHSVCCCALIRWFLITFFSFLKALKFFRILFYFFLWNLKTLPVKYWNGNKGSQQRQSTVSHGLNSRFFISIFEFFHACAVLKRSITPKINGKRSWRNLFSSVSRVQFPEKACRIWTFKRPSMLLHLH